MSLEQFGVWLFTIFAIVIGSLFGLAIVLLLAWWVEACVRVLFFGA
jgi:hypothetical protein